MKLFLDTADVAAITRWSKTGIIDGVTTNPTHLAQAEEDPTTVIQNICKLFPKGFVSVEVTEQGPQDVYDQAKRITGLADNILVKVPCHVDYYEVIARLVQEGVALNITLVFSVLQALYMCKLGVAFISPFVGRLNDISAHGNKTLHDICDLVQTYGYPTRVLAASLRGVQDLCDALKAGADAATVPLAVIEKSTKHPLTDRGIETFTRDWNKRNVERFP